MAQIIQNLGKIIPSHKGSFNPDVQYRIMDEVFYFGSSYRAVEIPPLGTIPTNEDYWVKTSESSARLTDVEVIDTSLEGEVTIRFHYEDLTHYDVTTGSLFPETHNSDWEATEGPAEILNKPSLGNAAFSSVGTGSGDVAAGDHRHDNASTEEDGFLSKEDKIKLDTIATNATSNNTNAFLLNRGNHTGTQAVSTVDGLQTALNSKVNTSTVAQPDGVASLDSTGRLPIAQGGGQPIVYVDFSSGDLSPSALHSVLNTNGFYKLAATNGGPLNFPASWNSFTGQASGTVEGYTSSSTDYSYCYQILTGPLYNRWMRRAVNSTTWGVWTEMSTALEATPSNSGLMSASDKNKLDGIAIGATNNQTNNYLLNRANHTGSQAISTVSGLTAKLTTYDDAGLAGPSQTSSGSGGLNVNSAGLGSLVSRNGTDSQCVTANLPSLGDDPDTPRWWNISTYGTSTRTTQIAQEILGVDTYPGRVFRRTKADSTWSAWVELAEADKVLNLTGGTLSGDLDMDGHKLKNADLSELPSGLNSVPIGFIAFDLGGIGWQGYLELGGIPFDPEVYPEFAQWLYDRGLPTNVTPDLTDLYLRHAGPLAGAAGTTQEDAMQGHWHQQLFGSASVPGPSLTASSINQTANGNILLANVRDAITDGVNGTPRIAEETRVKSWVGKWYIKAYGAFNDEGSVDLVAMEQAQQYMLRSDPQTLNTEQKAQVATNLSLPISKMWESSPQAIIAGGSLTLAHGLGVKPKILDFYLVCVVAQLGYTVNSTITMPRDNTQNLGLSAECSAAAVSIRFGTGYSGSVFAVLHRDTGSRSFLTNANWNLIVRAFA